MSSILSKVTAATLYEAVALALRSVRGKEWVSGLAEGNNAARIAVTDIPIEHSVRLQEFKTWLNKEGGSPVEMMRRRRIREILGLPDHLSKSQIPGVRRPRGVQGILLETSAGELQ